MCHGLRNGIHEEILPPDDGLTDPVGGIKKSTSAEVMRIFGYNSYDIIIGGVSMRQEITKILSGKAPIAESRGGTYSLYEYVKIARNLRPLPDNDELTDMLMIDLELRRELIYVTKEYGVSIGRSFL